MVPKRLHPRSTFFYPLFHTTNELSFLNVTVDSCTRVVITFKSTGSAYAILTNIMCWRTLWTGSSLDWIKNWFPLSTSLRQNFLAQKTETPIYASECRAKCVLAQITYWHIIPIESWISHLCNGVLHIHFNRRHVLDDLQKIKKIK